MLDEPAVKQTKAHGKDLGNRHDDLVAAAHDPDHIHVLHAVHSAGLLRKKLFNQRSDGINDKNQTQRANQMA